MTQKFILTKDTQTRLKSLGVGVVYLFGSYADGSAGKGSDMDIGIVMKDPKTVSRAVSTHDCYQKLYDQFSSIPAWSGTQLDIVFLQRSTLELRAHVVRTGKILYSTDTLLRLDFEEYTMRKYADFAPLRKMIDSAILKRYEQIATS
jgi:predicted nucleotidyltransferase